MTPQPTTADLQQRLLADLTVLARPRHARWDELGLMAVRSFLKGELSALGPLEEHHFTSGSDAGVNFILKLPGRHPQREPLLIGAHYDGPLQSIGADDNASGVAALLELARRWSQEPPNRPVWLVAFDQEEWGMLGSAALAAHLKASGQKLKLMVSLEMLAYTAEHQNYPIDAMRRIFGVRGDFIALVANTGSSLLLPGLAKAMGAHVNTKVLPVPNGGKALPDGRLSDHSPFWDQGYNALMVTDTSFMRNPHYHQMGDTIDTLDLPFFASVVEGLDQALRGL